MSDKKKIKAKGVVPTAEAIEYLQRLLSLAQQGSVAVVSGDRGLELEIPQFVKLEVEVKEKDGKQELSMELAWSDKYVGAEDLDLRITSPKDPDVQECLRSELDAQEQPPCAEV